MEKKLTVKDILNSKGKRKLAEVYTHNALEAEACEKAGVEMIVSSENNNVSELIGSPFDREFSISSAIKCGITSVSV